MPRKTENHQRLLDFVTDLRVADLELLQLCLIREGFGIHAVRWATEVLLKKGKLLRLWKYRDPKFRVNRGSARQVFLTSEKLFSYLRDPRKEHIIEHELMIARFHAAAKPKWWEQGKGTQIHRRGFKLTPDAFFQVSGQHYFLEADTGNERVRSDDPTRRTIEKKIRRYGLADRDEIPQEQFEIPGFSVIFMTPRRSDPKKPSGRELSILDAIQESGRKRDHAPRFFRIVSETEVMDALLSRRRLSLSAGESTLEEAGARPTPLP